MLKLLLNIEWVLFFDCSQIWTDFKTSVLDTLHKYFFLLDLTFIKAENLKRKP